MNNPAANDSGIVFLGGEEVLERLRVLKELVAVEISLFFAGESNPTNIEIKSFMQNTIGVMKLHTAFTELQLEIMVNKVFGSVCLRDFVLCLTDKFQILYGDEYLINTIARAVGQTAPATGKLPLTLIPAHILENMMVDEAQIRDLLRQNKWLTTVLLIHLTMTVLSDIKQTPEKAKSK